ncbi:NADPH dehydrogenase [Cordyceps militaris CM01]|uniref:NADPH dehydrogenase n=1 Tax=Cordyceps militaris (strain CM01) TaxID=983644 RepID=G3JSG8_CORMM|nr:NADPH dehydrogenase [Cordyceps militaris CM01]EGX88760.1 NADPH dehydrogenase [Cordyceps militaris CM01]
MASSNLFRPITVGNTKLQHRIVMAPLTRFRADENNVPLPNMLEYYTQRASTPGTLIIAEATQISPRHCGGANAPGLWNAAQVAAWRNITDAVHARGCAIYCHLCAPGRAGRLDGYPLYSASAVPMEAGATVPQAMTEQEIWACVEDFRTAAANAMEAGFDGVELHGANGYLLDQFSQSTCNVRDDGWGGSVENRARFILEATKAVTEAIGSDKTGVRLSPWSTFQGMKMGVPHAQEQFSYIIGQLKKLPLSYLHLIESRVVNSSDCEKKEGLEFAFRIWDNHSPVLVAGGFNSETARSAVDEEYKQYSALVVFGRYFVSTPDLVFRLKHQLEPNAYDRSTFYTPMQSRGYTDYPFSDQFLAQCKA